MKTIILAIAILTACGDDTLRAAQPGDNFDLTWDRFPAVTQEATHTRAFDPYCHFGMVIDNPCSYVLFATTMQIDAEGVIHWEVNPLARDVNGNEVAPWVDTLAFDDAGAIDLPGVVDDGGTRLEAKLTQYQKDGEGWGYEGTVTWRFNDHPDWDVAFPFTMKFNRTN